MVQMKAGPIIRLLLPHYSIIPLPYQEMGPRQQIIEKETHPLLYLSSDALSRLSKKDGLGNLESGWAPAYNSRAYWLGG